MYGRMPDEINERDYLEGMLGREATAEEIRDFFGEYNDWLDCVQDTPEYRELDPEPVNDNDPDDTPPTTPNVLPVVAQRQALVKAVARNVDAWLLMQNMTPERKQFYRKALQVGAVWNTRYGSHVVLYVNLDGVTPDTGWPKVVTSSDKPLTQQFFAKGLGGCIGLPVQRQLIEWHTGNSTNTAYGTRELTSQQWRIAYAMHLRYVSQMALRRAKTRYNHFYWMSGIKRASEGRKYRLQCEMVRFSQALWNESCLLLAS